MYQVVFNMFLQDLNIDDLSYTFVLGFAPLLQCGRLCYAQADVEHTVDGQNPA